MAQNPSTKALALSRALKTEGKEAYQRDDQSQLSPSLFAPVQLNQLEALADHRSVAINLLLDTRL